MGFVINSVKRREAPRIMSLPWKTGKLSFVAGVLGLFILAPAGGAFQATPFVSHVTPRHRMIPSFSTRRFPSVSPRTEYRSSSLSMVFFGAGKAVAATTTAVAQTTTGHATFWQLAGAFVSGGLFFSTLIAAAGAIISYGWRNILKLILLVATVVRTALMDIVDVFRVSVSTAFKGEPSRVGTRERIRNRWAEAGKALKEGFSKVKQTYTEGLDAIRLQTQFVAGTVGAAGLFPIQYAMDRLTPLTFAGPMEEAFKEACIGVPSSAFIRKVKMKSFDVGEVSPKLEEARLYDVGKETIAFDVGIKWDSSIDAKVDVVTKNLRVPIPVSLRNVKFEGEVRVIVADLQKAAPGFGAMLLSFPKPPKLAFDVKVLGGEITKVRWLRSELTKNIEDAINSQLLWPKRTVVPAQKPPTRPVDVLSAKELDELSRDDPLLREERKLTDSYSEDVTKYTVANPDRPLDSLDIILEGNGDNETDTSLRIEDDVIIDGDSEASSSSSETKKNERCKEWWQRITGKAKTGT